MNLAGAIDIKMLVLDVDGVLSDGKLYFSNAGEEIKSFNVQDGLGIKLLQRSGVVVAIITGRRSQIVANRAQELGIEHVIQGEHNKLDALTGLCGTLALELAEIAYMGDDLPDLGAIRACGLGLAPRDANPNILEYADWVSQRDGGNGAVREACELIMRAKGSYDHVLDSFR